MPIDIRADNFASHLKRAQDALNAGDAVGAEREAIAALAFAPTNAGALLILSQTSDRQKLWDAAELTALQAVKAAPANAYAHYRVGWCRVQCNRPATAHESLKRAAELYPSWGRYHTMWGYALAEAMIEPKLQRELALKGAAVTSTDEWAHSIGAQILNLLGEPVLAEQFARVALAKNKAEGHMVAIAVALRLQARLEEALVQAEKIVVDYPKGSGGWAELAEVLTSLGRGPEAIAAAQKSIELAPRSWEAHHALVRGHLALRDREQARKAAQAAAELNSEHPRMVALPLVVTEGKVLWPTTMVLGQST